MENTTLPHITLIAAIIGTHFNQTLSLMTAANHLESLKVCSELAITVYKVLEPDLIGYGDITYLDNVVNKTKEILNNDYNIRLFP